MLHGGKSFKNLLFLMRGKDKSQQGLSRSQHGEEGEIVTGFQQIAKKTRVTRGDTDQKRCGTMCGRQADRTRAAKRRYRPGFCTHTISYDR